MYRRRSHQGGFTLLEILIVLVIVGLISGMSIRGLRAITKSDLRASTSKMSGAIRYLFDRASTTGKYHRLVIDVDEGRYWAEVSDDRFYIPREPETEASLKKLAEVQAQLDEKERQVAEASRNSAGFDMTKVEPQDFRPKRVRFGAFKETTLKPVKMKNTKIMDVYTPRLADPVTTGRAYLYFFPLGQAEAAIVHLSDAAGESVYSLVVHPVTGRVRIYNEYIKPPFEDQVDDEGNRAQ